jgi:hypothetical protein
VDVVAYDERERPYVAWFVVVALALAAAVVSAAVVLLLRRTDADPNHRTTTPNPAPTSCTALRAHADQVLHDAQVLAQVLATQTRVMNDLLAHRTTLDKALPQVLPQLAHGSQQSVQLDKDASAYAAAAKGCPR